ncbi:MAG: hypothetical protein RIG27_34280 [Coleofasciculus sp. F4-SAH-05]
MPFGWWMRECDRAFGIFWLKRRAVFTRVAIPRCDCAVWVVDEGVRSRLGYLKCTPDDRD